MSQTNRPTIFSTALFSPAPHYWRGINPASAGATNGSFIGRLIGWTLLLTLFIWFGGLVHLDAEGVRLSWSEISSTRIGAAGEHVIATFSEKEFSIGPYTSEPLTVARCIASVLTVAGSIFLMRFLILPMTWDRKADLRVNNLRRAAANLLCGQIMAAQVLWWIAIATLLFLAAMIAPASMLTLARIFGRGLIGVIVLLGPASLMIPHFDPMASLTDQGAIIHSSWVAALVQFLVGAALLVMLYFAGAAFIS